MNETRKTIREIFSEVTGIAVVTEDDQSFAKRVKEERSYHIRRYEIASDAAGDHVIRARRGPARSSVLRFLNDTAQSLDDFDPESMGRNRWLEISGFKIPLPPKHRRKS